MDKGFCDLVDCDFICIHEKAKDSCPVGVCEDCQYTLKCNSCEHYFCSDMEFKEVSSDFFGVVPEELNETEKKIVLDIIKLENEEDGLAYDNQDLILRILEALHKK